MSTLNTDRSRWSSPWRSAMAFDSPSDVRSPRSTSIASGVVCAWRAPSTASSTRSLDTRLSSTMTSVRKRPWPPTPRGFVTPFQGAPSGCSSGVGRGRRWDIDIVRGLTHHGQVRCAAGPGLVAQGTLLDQHLQPVDCLDPPLARCALEVRAAWPVDEVHDARELVQMIDGEREVLEIG